MRKDIVDIRFKDRPVLLDRVLQNIQKTLTDKLTWLNYAFGRSYKIVDYRDHDRIVYPAVYNGSGEYISLLPNDNFGNFSWFDIYDPQIITDDIQSRPQLTFSGALIFWFDLSSIYEDDSMMYTEEVKNEILRLLATPGFIGPGCKISVDRVYENPENIYKGYLRSGEIPGNIDKQFFMYPYAGLRIEFTIKARELC